MWRTAIKRRDELVEVLMRRTGIKIRDELVEVLKWRTATKRRDELVEVWMWRTATKRRDELVEVLMWRTATKRRDELVEVLIWRTADQEKGPIDTSIDRSQWPRGLSRWSAAARLLGLWVRIPPGPWVSVCCECCVLSGRGLCVWLITCPEESYLVRCVGVWSWCIENEEAMAYWGTVARCGWKYLFL